MGETKKNNNSLNTAENSLVSHRKTACSIRNKPKNRSHMFTIHDIEYLNKAYITPPWEASSLARSRCSIAEHTYGAYIAVKGCLLTLRSLASQWRWSGRCHYHRTDRTPLVLSSTKSCPRGTFFSLFFRSTCQAELTKLSHGPWSKH